MPTGAFGAADFKVFDVNPNTGEPLWVSSVVRAAVNTIHHDATHPSRVILPLIHA